MNEIIVRLFQSHEADPGFFTCYEQALIKLGTVEFAEPVLREFELSLLDALGYGVDFGIEAQTHQPLSENEWYYFQTESGFVKVQNLEGVQSGRDSGNPIFRGRELLDIQSGDFLDDDTRKTAKQVLRIILNSHLGPAPLNSRNLFSRR
jgi:DNA repair protein RecO (recombination protein O)